MRKRMIPSAIAAVLLILLAVTPAQADQANIGFPGLRDLPCGKTYTSVLTGFNVTRGGITTMPQLRAGEAMTVTLKPLVVPYTGDPPGTLEIVGDPVTTFTVPAGWGDTSDPADANRSVEIAPFFRLRYVADPAGFDGAIGVTASLRGDQGYSADVDLPEQAIRVPACPVATPVATAVAAPTRTPAATKALASKAPAATKVPETARPSADPTSSPVGSSALVATLVSPDPPPLTPTVVLATSSGPDPSVVVMVLLLLGAAMAGTVAVVYWRRGRMPS
jgi:hypothetical protein